MQWRHKYFNLRALRRSRRGLLTTAILLTITVILAILLTYEKLINYYAYDLLGKTIKRTVELKTDGFYRISYDSIHVDFINSRATLFDFRVEVDSGRFDASNKEMTLFVAHVPRVDADIINLFEIIFKDRLKLKAIILQRPEVWIAQPRQDEGLGLSRESGDIYKIVSSQIREFNLGSFGLKQAKISYKRDLMSDNYDFIAGNISFIIQNFGWNSDDTEPHFHSDHISLLVKDQSFKLKDSIHLVTFDSVLLSTGESRVELINVHLYPRSDVVRQGKSIDKNAYSIAIPSLSLHGVDFNKAYTENILAIDKIDLQSPNLAMDNFVAADKSKDVDPYTEELVKMITELFNIIEVADLNINDGDMNILRDRAPFSSRFKATNIFAYVKNVRIDPMDYSKITYDSATVGLKDYYYSLPDSIHVLKFGSLSFVTTDKSNIKIDSLKVFDRLSFQQKTDRGGFININAPQVKISGFEFENFIDNNHLAMNNISIERPDITFHMKDTTATTSENINLQEVVSSVFDFLHADSINLIQGTVRLMKKGKSFIQFNGLETAIGEVINGKGRSNLYLDSLQMKVSASSILLTPPGHLTGHLTGVTLSQNKKTRLNIRQARFDGDRDLPLNASLNQVFVQLPGISVFINSPKNALNGLKAQEFELLIDKDLLQKQQNELQQTFSFERIQLGSGEIRIVDKNHPVLTANVKFLKFSELSLGQEPEVRGLELSLGESIVYGDNNILTFSKLRISDRSRQLSAKSVSIKGSANILIDSISAKDLDVGLLVNQNKLNVREIMLRNSTLQLGPSQNEKVKTMTYFQDLRQLLNEKLKDIKVDRLILANGSIDNKEGVAVNGANIDIRGVRIAENERWDYKIPFIQSMTARIESISAVSNKSVIALDDISMDSRADAINVNHFSFKEMKNSNIVKGPGLHMSIPDIYKLVNEQKINVDRIKIIKPDITLQLQEEKSSENKILEGTALKELSIRHLELNEGRLLIKRNGKDDFELKKFFITLEQVFLNSQTDLSKNVLVFNEVTLTPPDVSFKTKDELNTISMDKVTFASADSSLTINNLHFTPVSQFEFFDKKRFESDWIKASVGSVKLSGLHLDKFLNHQQIDSRYLLIDQANIKVYRDKNMPDPPPRDKVMYHIVLKNYEKPINIDKAGIRRSDITYTEFAEGALQPGSISFEEFSADFSNITNRAALLKKNPSMTFDARAMVMGKAKLELSMSFDMTSPKGAFTIGGKLAATPLRIFNNITVYNANIDIREGYAESLFFNARANDEVAYGNMEFRYEDLKIYILDKPSESTSQQGKAIASFFANTFVINKNNPRLFKLREGKIYFVRNPNKSLFNYWTKSFLSGLVASIGINNNKKEFERMTNDEENR